VAVGLGSVFTAGTTLLVLGALEQAASTSRVAINTNKLRIISTSYHKSAIIAAQHEMEMNKM